MPGTTALRAGYSLLAAATYLLFGSAQLAIFQAACALVAVLILVATAARIPSPDREDGFAAHFRSLFDVLQLGIAVYATGGLRSPLLVGFTLPIAFSSLGRKRTRGLVAACAAGLITLCIDLVFRMGTAPIRPLVDPLPLLEPIPALTLGVFVLTGFLALNLIVHRMAEKRRAAAAVADTRARELAELNDLSRILNSSVDMSVIFDGIYDHLVRTTRIDTIWLMLVDDQGRNLYTYWGRRPEELAQTSVDFFYKLRVPLDERGGTLANTVRTQTPLYIPDFDDLRGRNVVNALDGKSVRSSRTDFQIATQGQLRSLLQLPLIVDRSVIAVLNTTRHDEPLNLSAAELARLRDLAEPITAALHTAILLEKADRARAESEKARHRLQSLAELSRSVTQTADISAIMDEVSGFSEKHFGLGRLALFQVEGNRELVLRYWREGPNLPMPPDAARLLQTLRVPLRPEGGTLFRTFTRKKPLYVPSFRPEAIASRYDAEIQTGLRFQAFVHAPLLSGGETIGILAFACPLDVRLSTADMKVIQAMADQVAGALRNARQLEEVLDARAATEALAALARRANQETDLTMIAAAVHAVLNPTIGDCSIALYVIDEKERQIVLRALNLNGRKGEPADYEAGARFIPLSPEGGTLFRAVNRRRLFHSDRIGAKWLAHSPHDTAAVQNFGFRWFVHAPLVVADRVVGVLGIADREDRRLGTAALTLITRVAEQVAGAVRTVELLRQAEEARAEVSRMASFARSLNEHIDLETISAGVFRFLEDRFGLDQCSLLLVDEPAGELWAPSVSEHTEASLFWSTFRAPLVPETGSLYRTFLKKKPLYLSRISIEGLGPVDTSIVQANRLQSFVQVPLVVEDRTVGIVVATSQRKLHRTDIETIGRFCEQIAGAVRAAGLLGEAQLQRDLAVNARTEVEVLSDFARRINEQAGADLDVILRQVFEYIRDNFGIEEGVLSLVDEARHCLAYRSSWTSYPWSEEQRRFFETLEVPLTRHGGMLAISCRRKQAVYLPSLQPELGMDMDRRIIETLGLQSLLHLPILVQNRTIGIIWATNKSMPLLLNKEDLRRLQTFADQMAGAIHSSQLLGQLRVEKERAMQAHAQALEAQSAADSARAEIQKLAEVSRTLNETSDLDIILDRVVSHIVSEFGIDGVMVMLADQASQELRVIHHSIPETATPEMLRFGHSLRVPFASRSVLVRVLERKQPFFAPRLLPTMTQGNDTDSAIVGTLRLNSFFLAPLVVQQEAIGLILMANTQKPLQMPAERRSRIERFCAQIAGALHGSNLLHEVQKARSAAEREGRTIQKLNEFSKALNATSDVSKVVEQVFDYLDAEYQIDSGILLLPEAGTGELVAAHARVRNQKDPVVGAFARGLRVKRGLEGGIVARAFERGKKLYVTTHGQRDIFRVPYPGMERDREIVNTLQLPWFLLLPLVVQEETAGILLVSSFSQPEGLSRQEITAVERFADQIAGGVQTSNLLARVSEERDRAEVARREIEKLNQISQQINSTTNLGEIFETVFDYLTDTYGFDGYIVLTPEKSGRTTDLVLLHHADRNRSADVFEYSRTLRIPLDETGGIVAKTFARRKPLLVPDVTRDIFRIPYPGIERDQEMIRRFYLRAFQLIPLVVHGEGVAMIMCASSTPLRLGTAARESIARFAEQVAGAIHTNRLLSEVRHERDRAERAREETESLADLSRRANEGHDLDGIVAAVMEVVARQFEADSLAMFVADGRRKHLMLRSLFSGSKRIELDDAPALIREVPLIPRSGGLFRTFEKKRVFHLDRASEDWMQEHPVDGTLQKLFSFAWFVDAPLILDEEAIGVLAFSGRAARRLLRSEIQFVERIAAQVAGAVRTAELLRTTETARLDSEQARADSDRLLARILPARVADELKREGQVEPLFYDMVSVLFTDFVGFTQASQRMRPDELVQELDGCFSQFDEVVRRHGLEKLKTIGDSYMCAAGLPELSAGHAVDACLTGIEFKRFMDQMGEVKQALGHSFWQIRIGIHSGPVTAGVIGTHKFAYDIWGDTVNTASRMESSGRPGEVNISGATYELVKEFFDCEYRGKIQAKGKGDMDMYFLRRIRPELSADEDGLLPNSHFIALREQLLEAGGFYAAESPGSPLGVSETIQRDGW